MAAALILVAALAGAIVGSFLTVVAHRVPRGESIVAPRSQCPSCGVQIAAYDNVPVVSWALLGGRSRCCNERISGRYPLAESSLAVLFAAVAVRYHDDLGAALLGFVFVSMLLTITLTDLERRIIPNRVLAVASAIGLVIVVFSDPTSLPERAAAGIGAGGVLLAAALAYPGGMGMGDVKLAAAMGLFLGVAVVPALLVALLAGSLVGIGMIARDGAAARKRAIPFGPFLAIGGVTGLFAGQALIDLYLATFA
jgi:leader peptidase (prepilin peptidase)/N-methyltransferase